MKTGLLETRPEFMPLDNSLNADIQYAPSLHCALTAHLNDEDDRKFSMRTPLTIVDGIRRLWGAQGGNVPSSKRIMEDCDRALRAFGEVYAHGGKMVPGLASRNGHRNHIAGRNTDGWGGAARKKCVGGGVKTVASSRRHHRKGGENRSGALRSDSRRRRFVR